MPLNLSDWELAMCEDAITMYFEVLNEKGEAYKDLAELGKKLERYIYGCSQEPKTRWNIKELRGE
jgi:hypothetical protein